MCRTVFVLTLFFAFFFGVSDLSAAKWTLMVYLDADNNLESQGIEDFLEMAEVGSTDQVNVAVQFDRTGDDDTRYGDWTDTRRFKVTQAMIPAAKNALMDLGELNMGDPKVLSDFILWSKKEFPADRYALVFWNHGGGWRSAKAATVPVYRDICADYTDKDTLRMYEVRQALSHAGPVDLIGFDACLMGMIEVAWEVQSGAKVAVGSEDLEGAAGWPYNTLLTDLTQNPDLTASGLATRIVARYMEGVTLTTGTMSAVDLTTLPVLVDRVGGLAQALIDHYADADRWSIAQAADGVLAVFPSVILAEDHTMFHPYARGLAVYFPGPSLALDVNYNSTQCRFAQDTRWDEFLRQYRARMAESWLAEKRAGSEEFNQYENIDLGHFALRVRGPLAARSDEASTGVDQSVRVRVTDNDAVFDGSPAMITHLGTPAHGTAQTEDNLTVLYTPNGDYTGPDEFTYTIANDQNEPSTATVTVRVTGALPKDPPAIDDATAPEVTPTSTAAITQSPTPISQANSAAQIPSSQSADNSTTPTDPHATGVFSALGCGSGAAMVGVACLVCVILLRRK